MGSYVVTYDISDNRIRQKVGDALGAYGRRVNYSVFEIELKSKSQISALEDELLSLINPKIDSLRFYSVCANCMQRSWSLGEEPAPFEQSGVYFF